MKQDFPPNELKPLEMIYKAMDDGRYTCYGLMDGEEIVAYTYLVKLAGTKDYLIDFLAVSSGRRNEGIGSKVLHKLHDMLQDADSIIGEIENPSLAQSEEEKKLQTRRYNFYMRNGFTDTGVTAVCFKAPFKLIELVINHTHNEEQIKGLYRKHYQALLPAKMYEDNVKV